MVITPEVIHLSRFQFALTAIFHFLFVPLTLGLSWILVIMETAYLITGKQVYKDMTRYWGKLFGINLAMGVITGLTLEFQFGTNWAYYSQYVGDIFGIPLSLEGMVAFMIEGVFFGMFFFGWSRVGKTAHWVSTVALAVGSNLSALLILVANGWMQHPVGAYFNFHTMRMELAHWSQVFYNPDAQVRFVHTLAAGYTTSAVFVLAISAFFILKKRDLGFAKRSFAIAAGFGLASVLSVIILGDQNGLNVDHVQAPKMAAMEGVWNTPKAPAGWDLIAFPDSAKHKNDFEIKIPWALSLITSHDLSGTVEGINQIIAQNKIKVANGAKAYAALQKLRTGDQSAATQQLFNQYKADLGYGLLLKQYTSNPATATPAEINKAANDTIPDVWTLFYSFRIMVLCGILLLILFVAATYACARGTAWDKRWLLKFALFCLPLPWIAAEFGWILAEVGRQPWTVYGILPTFLSTSSLSAHQLWTSISGFLVLFGGLTIVEVYLMVKYIKKGPSSLNTGRYHFERKENQS